MAFFSFKKNPRQRRLEVRRSAPAQESWYVRWWSQPGSAGSLGVAVLFFVLAAAMNIWPVAPLPYRQGQYVPHDITARVKFRILNESLRDDLIRTKAGSTPATFRLNSALLDEIVVTLEKVPAKLAAAGALAKVDPALVGELGLAILAPEPTTKPAAKTQPAVKPSAKRPPAKKPSAKRLRESQEDYAAWVALSGDKQRPRLEVLLGQLRSRLKRCYLVRGEQAAEQQSRTARQVKLINGKTQNVKVVDLIGLDETQKVARAIKSALDGFAPKLRLGVQTYLLGKLSAQPIYLYDNAQSLRDSNQAVGAIEANPPETCYKHYPKGQVLAKRSLPAPGAGEILGLSEAELQLLSAEQKHYFAVERETHPWRFWLSLVNRAVILLLMTVLLVMYVGYCQPHLIHQNFRALTLAALLLLTLAITKAALVLPWVNPHIALLGVCVAVIILTIVYDQRFALGTGSILAAFVVFQIRSDFGMLVVLLAGLILCVFQLREIRTRSKLIIVSAVSAAVVFVVVWAFSVQQSTPWRFALQNGAWAAGAVLLAGLIVQSLLPAIERIFGVATGSTLLEWCDASKPLLKRLAMESPGTYNHSLQLGTMCETAAESIGARGLLARVGAYYHDIGKMNQPDYFTENQPEGLNKHEKLSPAMSLLVILGHVKDGLEMARQYGLPAQLREFISAHHGTTVVKYFYLTAKEKALAEGQAAPDDNQFRYPGPKPQSKEAAILMLADGAEGSVRAMTEPTPTRIRTQVHHIVTDRLEDGQLDDCEMTLREVHQIENSIVKSLCSMYHGRIAYPKDDKAEKTNGNGNGNGKKVNGADPQNA